MTTETTETKKRAINRLKTMRPLRDLLDKLYETTLEAQKAGKPTVWSMQEGGYGSPFLIAMDIESVYPENYGALCAASGDAPAYLERCEAEGFPTHLCGYARNCIGYTARMMELGKIPPEAPKGGMPKPVLLLSSGRVCDARYKWFQALGRYMDTPVWTLELPQPGSKERLMEGSYEHDVKFLVNELREFVVFLERLVGKKMDWDYLAKIVDGIIELDGWWYKINQLRKARPGPMHSRDFWSSMGGFLLRAPDPKAVADLYRDMYYEVKERVDKKISAINYPEKYRMVFAVLPPWHSLGFFDQLAERGWNFVIETSYHRPGPIDLTGVTDPIEKLVRHRYQDLSRLIDDAFGPEEAPMVKERIKKQGYFHELTDDVHVRYARTYQCDGAFLHPLLTCRSASANLQLFESQIMEFWKVPSITIEGDIVDTRLFNPVDALRKAEAFEETMDYYKEVRKKAGMEW